jgi:hypothetical protein
MAEYIEDDQEVRTDICKLDEQAGALIEKITDKYGHVPDDPDLYAFLDILNDLQDKITELQELMSWI